MKIKTSEASGIVLDWLVAGLTNPEWGDEDRAYNTYSYVDCGDEDDGPYTPSTDWAQGGPIIEREGIELFRYEAPGKAVYKNPDADEADLVLDHVEPSQWRWMAGDKLVGPTPLIAAMRCYVASKLGEEVDVPDELCRT